MKIAIILNGISLHKKIFYKKYFPLLQKVGSIEVFETHSTHDGVSLAQRAIHKRFDVIVAAGGDGTVHQVVNGMMREDLSAEKLPMLAVIPIGSGNDFARSMGNIFSPDVWMNLLIEQKPTKVDVGKITFLDDKEKQDVYFINEADIGMGPEVVKKVLSSGRPFGSAVAYYLSILSTFISYKPFQATLTSDHWQWTGKVRTLAIANGKFYGNGLGIAPDAILNDGKYSTFIVEDVSVLDFVWFSNTLKQCRKVKHEKVHYHEAEEVELRAESKAVIEADGEIVGTLPVKINILPQRIRLLM